MTTVTDLKSRQAPCTCNEGNNRLMEQVTSLKSEVISLQKDVVDLRERIGAVRGWIKNSLLIFSIFCLLVISGHYVFLLQLTEFEVGLKQFHSDIIQILKIFKP